MILQCCPNVHVIHCTMNTVVGFKFELNNACMFFQFHIQYSCHSQPKSQKKIIISGCTQFFLQEPRDLDAKTGRRLSPFGWQAYFYAWPHQTDFFGTKIFRLNFLIQLKCSRVLLVRTLQQTCDDKSQLVVSKNVKSHVPFNID